MTLDQLFSIKDPHAFNYLTSTNLHKVTLQTINVITNLMPFTLLMSAITYWCQDEFNLPIHQSILQCSVKEEVKIDFHSQSCMLISYKQFFVLNFASKS